MSAKNRSDFKTRTFRLSLIIKLSLGISASVALVYFLIFRYINFDFESNAVKEAKQLAGKIQKDLPETRIVFISPKPSIARVHLKNSYITFNKKLKKYCEKNGKLEFADVWYPMLDNKGNVFKDVFLEDGLHMNKKGYDIWGKVINEFLK